MKEKLRPDPTIARFLSGVHVMTSPKAMLRKVKAHFGKKWERLDRIHRRFAVASALLVHAKNRLEYINVMHRGTTKPWPKFYNPFFFDTETKEVSIVKKS